MIAKAEPGPKSRRSGKPADEMDQYDEEFLRVVDHYRRHVNKFPAVTDYLAILKSLGWRKTLGKPN